MADLRMTLLALAACGSPDALPAQPERRSSIRPPATWQALPAIAQSARAAARAPGVAVEGSEAWGEPAMGCYAAWIALRGSTDTAEQLAERIRDGLGAAGIVAANDPGDGLAWTVERAPYRGRLRARIGADDGGIEALACVANEREPAACAAACAPLVEALR